VTVFRFKSGSSFGNFDVLDSVVFRNYSAGRFDVDAKAVSHLVRETGLAGRVPNLLMRIQEG
jgi:hypothetical protein